MVNVLIIVEMESSIISNVMTVIKIIMMVVLCNVGKKKGIIVNERMPNHLQYVFLLIRLA